jgi:hypothetical protein
LRLVFLKASCRSSHHFLDHPDRARHCLTLCLIRCGRFLDDQSVMRNCVKRRAIITCENVLEGQFDITCIKCRCFNEGQIVFACEWSVLPLYKREDRSILANCLASSVGTARRCRRSLLFPTSIITMFASAWSRSSLSHRVTLS